MQHYTTIEESKKLLELGLNPESADMYYKLVYDEDHMISTYEADIVPFKFCGRRKALPCWSLGALLEILEYPQIFKDRLGDEDVWFCKCYINGWKEMHQSSAESTPIEAAYSMVCWLIENGYLKKGE